MRSLFHMRRSLTALSMLAILEQTHAAFDVHTYAALGESFASGPSAGDPYPDAPKACRRYTHAYGPELNGDDRLQGKDGRKFEFIACSGSKLKQVYEDPGGDGSKKPAKSQANQLDGLNPELTTLSMGGNDIGFVNLLDRCVYRFYDPLCIGCGFSGDCSDDCDKVVEEVQGKIDSDDFKTGYDKAIKAIFDKAPKTNLFVELYPRFFNADTDQCDKVQFVGGCSGKLGGFLNARRTLLPLTKDRRGKMNTLTDNLNKAIKEAVGRNQPDRSSGASSQYVNTDTLYEGHRFCEEGVTEPSYRNDKIWFYPYEYSVGNTLASISAYDNSTNCQDILDNDTGDMGDYYECEIATNLADSKDKNAFPFTNSGGDADPTKGVDATGSSDSLPDFLARIFHPTKAGHMAYKDSILTIYTDYTAAGGDGGGDPKCPDDLVASLPVDAAKEIQGDWAKQKGTSYEAMAGMQCGVAGLATKTDGRSQASVCTKDGNTDGGKVDYGDLADGLQKIIDDKACNKDDMVGGTIEVGTDGMYISLEQSPT